MQTGAFHPPLRSKERKTSMKDQAVTVPFRDLTEAQKAAVLSERRIDRTYAAMEGLGLDRLVSDPEWQVREEVANRGYALDVLAGDEHPLVRAAVASQGAYPEMFAKDPAWQVRYAVVKSGYVTDDLMRDKDPYVKDAARKAATPKTSRRAQAAPLRVPCRTERRRTPEAAECEARGAVAAAVRTQAPRRSHVITA